MFEGTDLSAAYGYDAAPMSGGGQHVAPPGLMANPPPPPATSLDAPRSTAPHATAPEVSYAPPQQMYAHQSAQAAPAEYAVAGDGFFDRLGRKKWEVLKLIVFSLIILLALSADNVAKHYLNSYIGASFLTATQELLVRLSYPVAVILLIWIIKAML
jgi:hypothetical protein